MNKDEDIKEVLIRILESNQSKEELELELIKLTKNLELNPLNIIVSCQQSYYHIIVGDEELKLIVLSFVTQSIYSILTSLILSSNDNSVILKWTTSILELTLCRNLISIDNKANRKFGHYFHHKFIADCCFITHSSRFSISTCIS